MSNILDKVKVTNSGYLRICQECTDCKETLADLPTEDVEINTRYFVYETELYYTWNGTEWIETGGEFDLGGSGGGGGSTPTIGENGNWFIDGVDTGQPSRGEKGDKGDPGSDATVTIDTEISTTSQNPVANNVIAREFSKYLTCEGGTMTGDITGDNGGIFCRDGNVYINCHGYTDWLSNILTNISGRFTWNILGNYPIQTIVNLPSGWNELSVAIYCNGYCHKIHICETEVLSNENTNFLAGSYFADNNAYGCHVLVSKTAIYLANATYNYELKTDSFMKIMYR